MTRFNYALLSFLLGCSIEIQLHCGKEREQGRKILSDKQVLLPRRQRIPSAKLRVSLRLLISSMDALPNRSTRYRSKAYVLTYIPQYHQIIFFPVVLWSVSRWSLANFRCTAMSFWQRTHNTIYGMKRELRTSMKTTSQQ